MALIKCPECGNMISDAAGTCPQCGFPVKQSQNDIVRIKIDQNPSVPGSLVRIYEAGTDTLLASANSGGVAEFRTDKPVNISFVNLSKATPMLNVVVSPLNGGKYQATWGSGFLGPKITSCYRVDSFDTSADSGSFWW